MTGVLVGCAMWLSLFTITPGSVIRVSWGLSGLLTAMLPFVFVLLSISLAVASIASAPRRVDVWVANIVMALFAWTPPIASVVFMEWAIDTQGLIAGN
ncbi:MAG: hypothetical protein AAGB29_00655 [Planctomycetota bacterium]